MTKSMPRIGLFLSFVLAACTPVAAGPVRSITVLGFGEAQGRPDQAEVQVAVETFAEAVAAATSENEDAIQSVIMGLRDAGVAADDIQTSNFNLWAEQRYDDFGPTGIVGYHVTNQVNVTVRDVDTVSAVLEAAIDAGANSIYGVFFSLADPGAVEAVAREAAMRNARERAEALAALSGVTLGEVLTVSEVIGGPVSFAGGSNAEGVASAGPSIAPGQLNYSLQIQVTFAID